MAGGDHHVAIFGRITAMPVKSTVGQHFLTQFKQIHVHATSLKMFGGRELHQNGCCLGCGGGREPARLLCIDLMITCFFLWPNTDLGCLP